MLYTESEDVFQFSQRHDPRRIGLRLLGKSVQSVDDVVARDLDAAGFVLAQLVEECGLLFLDRRPHLGTVEDGRGHGLGEFIAGLLGRFNLVSLIEGYELEFFWGERPVFLGPIFLGRHASVLA